MKRNRLLFGLALGVSCTTAAFADQGPYYVSYPNYCNVKKVYINSAGDIYGTEVGCTASSGMPLIGAFTVDGKAVVSESVNGQPYLMTYLTDGTLIGRTSNGGSVTSIPSNSYTVATSSSEGGASAPSKEVQANYSVATEAPDLSQKASLPPLPF